MKAQPGIALTAGWYDIIELLNAWVPHALRPHGATMVARYEVTQ